MTGNLSAAVTVSVNRTNEGTQIRFESRSKRISFASTIRSAALDEARGQLDDRLDFLKEALPILAVEDTALDEVYRRLHGIGLRITSVLFGTQPKVIQGLQDFWKAAVPFRNPAFPPLIECVGNEDAFLPLEFLPFKMDRGPAIASRAQFIAACRNLVGFSCVVRRAMKDLSLHGSLTLKCTPSGRVPIRYLYYEQLPGAKEELAWFTTTAAHQVEIDGPYPGAQEPLPSLASQIYDPGLRLEGGRREVPDQIQHFACHCYTRMTNPSDNEIELSGNGHDIRITLGEIGDEMVVLAARSVNHIFDMPLVMINACGSAMIRAAGALSFPHFFLRNGNRGFIGTETGIPDDVAAAFSQALYERFILHRLPIGRSVLGARNYLLDKFGNPLGIAYSLYADPQLYISPALEATTDVRATA